MTPLYNDNGNRSGNSSIPILIVLGFGLVMALFLGLTIGQGDMKKVYIMALGLVAFPVFLFLGDRYWVLLPFAMTVSLPAIPIVAGRSLGFGELWVVASLGAFILRVPFMTNKMRLFRAEYIPVLLYVGWAAFIFRMNGAGLAIFGASTVGGRSYLMIALAAAAFFLMCNQRLEEKQAKLIVWSLIASAVLSSAWNTYNHIFVQMNDELQEGHFYSWHQNLALLPLYFLPFAFAKYSLPDLVRDFRVSWLAGIGACYTLAAFSGKRAVFAASLMFPIISALARRQYAFVFLCGLLASVILTTLVIGHGRMFELPMTVQRVLWILPGDWDSSVRHSTEGSFRRTLNKLAKRQIRQYPIIGRGFGFTSGDAFLSTDPYALRKVAERGDHVGAFLMAVGGQWHSTWLGISAALGVPAAVFWGLIWIQMLTVSWWVLKRTEPGTYIYILAMVLFMLTVVEVFRSMTSGHAANNLWNAAWKIGVLLVMKWQIQEAASAERAASRPAPPAVARPIGGRFEPVPARPGVSPPSQL